MPYPPIYIINLKRTPERKLSIQRQLDAFNLNYEFVEAIDRYDLRSKEECSIIAYQLGIDTNNMETLYDYCNDLGALACLLSHVKVYNLIIENNIPCTCVLEDDAYLLPAFPKILIAAQQISWEVLMLSSQSAYVWKILLSSLCGFPKLICYKKYYPALNLFTAPIIALKFMKFLILEFILRHKNRLSKHKYIKKRTLSESLLWYVACEIGAIPNQDRRSWHKVAPNHYITTPSLKPNVTSGMAYMLTRSAAIKWKQAILSDRTHAITHAIDLVPYQLYRKKTLNLYIVTPPCVKAIYRYLVNSSN